MVVLYGVGCSTGEMIARMYVIFLCSGSIEADDQEGNSPRISPRWIVKDTLKETYQPGMYAQLMKKHVRE